MSFVLVFSALFALIVLIGAALIGYTIYKSRKFKINVFGVVIAFVGILGAVVVPSSFHTVEAGQIAVVKHLGEARNVRTAGTYFDFWLTEKYEYYDAKVQNMNITTQAYSKDAQTMSIAMNVQYKINTEKVIDIANQYGTISLLANRIESIATEKTKATLSSYSAMNIIETRSTISPLVESTIKEAVDEEYCVEIVAVVLTNIDFSEAFEKTVEDKMIAEQEKLKAEYEKETAIVNAEKELEVAKLQAQAKIEKAKADAESEIEVARAEATAVKLKSVEVARALGFNITETEILDDDGVVESVEYEIDFAGKSSEEIQLITEYLKYIEYLAKWNGELPDVITGESANIMIPTQK
ncbi:MAG: prohibitin family protein [Clostridia bacterium]|nr:prohibitin family protein [Clostridia bacterium]MBO5315756.1 prohibitin family protein [Clostridia bacterium]MBR3806447.1 prohibitin family protein [Clostridia bacterium]